MANLAALTTDRMSASRVLSDPQVKSRPSEAATQSHGALPMQVGHLTSSRPSLCHCESQLRMRLRTARKMSQPTKKGQKDSDFDLACFLEPIKISEKKGPLAKIADKLPKNTIL